MLLATSTKTYMTWATVTHDQATTILGLVILNRLEHDPCVLLNRKKPTKMIQTSMPQDSTKINECPRNPLTQIRAHLRLSAHALYRCPYAHAQYFYTRRRQSRQKSCFVTNDV